MTINLKRSVRLKRIVAKIQKQMKHHKCITVRGLAIRFKNHVATISRMTRPYELQKALDILSRLVKSPMKHLRIGTIRMRGKIKMNCSLIKLESRMKTFGYDACYLPNQFQSLIIRNNPSYVFINSSGSVKMEKFNNIAKLCQAISELEQCANDPY